MAQIQFEFTNPALLQDLLAEFSNEIVFRFKCTMGLCLQTFDVYQKDGDPWTLSLENLVELSNHLDMPLWAIRIII